MSQTMRRFNAMFVAECLVLNSNKMPCWHVRDKPIQHSQQWSTTANNNDSKKINSSIIRKLFNDLSCLFQKARCREGSSKAKTFPNDLQNFPQTAEATITVVPSDHQLLPQSPDHLPHDAKSCSPSGIQEVGNHKFHVECPCRTSHLQPTW